MPYPLPTTNRRASDSYTSSLSPTSPISYTSHPNRVRSPSPSRLQRLEFPSPGNHVHEQSRRRMASTSLAFTRHVRPYLSPRNVSSILLWTLAVWLIHHFLLPLPLPRISRSNQKPKASDHLLSTSFPPPPLRAGDDLIDSLDPRWRPFAPIPPPNPPFPRLRPTRFLPPKCLEQWFTDGETLCGKDEMGEEEKLDATWLWVNGSDHRWRDSMIHWRSEESVYSPEHHFREQNELVHSMRSVLDALPGHLRTFHLIVADYPFEVPADLSLLPTSLVPKLEALAAARERHSGRRIHSRDLLNSSEEKESANLTARISTSVSQALSSYLASAWRADVTVSLNDDFFLLRPHAVSDFHSPLYGSVIRFDHGYYQQVRPILDKGRFNDAGEVGGLYHANHILSQRFPRRLRPYFAHVPKVITRSLHHEASLMFKEDLAASSQRRFREMSLGEGDIQMQWLLTSLRVERWREALLWTYVVANLGNLESWDQWGPDARKELRDMFGLTEHDDDVVKIEVHRGERWTLEPGRMDKVFEQAGWEAPKATDFLFYMFKRLTFQYPECGDCLIMALVTASGPLGLSAFFPAKGTTYKTAPLPEGRRYPKYLPPPHLPLTPTWHEADFSLANVMSNTALPDEAVNLREYTMKLLSRYQYLSAKSVSHFHMLKSAEHAHRVFKMIQDNPKVSILGLNDDIEEDYEEVKGIMEEWFELRWPRKAVWERDWDPIKDRYVE
ncbi:hypothetical protein IAR55_005485 [Kwoniella newhampshirensis]|uniref:Uncharacterized protein n=1 Tax=Kwoniella newhampshirensis TaxID=1651941 RepID=A0AAW0YIK3_9TREE